VGAGGASKDQVARMVARHLNLKEAPANQHEADALALALCAHFVSARQNDKR
jgi:Holliday junction resolvasome RuvABC endonuclease subunit